MTDAARRPAPPAPPVPLSPVQADAVRRRELPPVEEVRHGVWSVAFEFGDGIDDHSLGYVVEGSDGALTVIDPGWGIDGNLDRLESALADVDHSLADIDLIAVTHLHADHLGGAEALRRVSGARIALHAAEQRALGGRTSDAAAADADIARWGAPAADEKALVASWGSGRHLPAVTADLLLEDGDLLPVAGRLLRAVHTPGHTAGHLCFVEPEQRLVFTGDHVLPRINPGIGLGGRTGTNPLTDYLASLDRMATLDVAGPDALEVCPGHEYRFTGLRERAEELLAHRADRSRDAAAALDDLTRPTVWQVAERMSWSGGISSLHGYRLGSALAQTEWHVQAFGRAHELRPA
ncbi:MBL fold metallo-hydrolase [Frigoribacterium sp. VKM Ac-2836]|uniref:MBL fold metallo-hydrolase n=1 Tax=Frigoribacterium sp. VKM Ac-2836 TaxID=2739014 RepID=UPI001567A979|nr:MBL fold metallo-hydrolase [Frigoribacterium sp. VKM Ac-2836]